jgi:hypothetical protein
MLRRIRYGENNGDFTIETFDPLSGKIRGSVEYQSITAGSEFEIRRQQFFYSAISVGGPFADQLPTTGCFKFNGDGHTIRRPAAGRVQDMCGYRAQLLSSFSSLNRVILLCSTAAMRNSFSGSFRRRRRRIASISAEVFPVAQTM